ncbi:MAG: hypothetical protein K2P03_01600, partial [Lachnospiraceae bacterium]|nr:hypothetical protein [Lachnospiraceae bacterium]
MLLDMGHCLGWSGTLKTAEAKTMPRKISGHKVAGNASRYGALFRLERNFKNSGSQNNAQKDFRTQSGRKYF